MSDNDSGKVSMQIDGHVCTISVDNVSKKNAYTPAMLDRLAELLTDYEDNDDLWVAIFCSVGEHTTAGLDMPRFFGPTAEPERRKPGLVDPFGLQRRCTKPVIAVVQGITYTVGIEMALAPRHRHRGGHHPLPATGIAPRHRAAGRRAFPLPDAHRLGQCDVPLFTCQEFSAERALQLGFVQEVHPFGKHMERARELAAIICECAPLGLRATKKAALTFIEAGEQAAVACIPQIREQVFATEDFKEGIRSFVERRQAKFVGR